MQPSIAARSANDPASACAASSDSTSSLSATSSPHASRRNAARSSGAHASAEWKISLTRGQRLRSSVMTARLDPWSCGDTARLAPTATRA